MSRRLQDQTNQLSRVNDEIKRINEQLKKLREIRKKQERALLNTMRSFRIEKIDGYTLKRLQKKYPLEEKRRRSTEEKKEDARILCRNVGIIDPRNFMAEFRKTQRVYA